MGIRHAVQSSSDHVRRPPVSKSPVNEALVQSKANAPVIRPARAVFPWPMTAARSSVAGSFSASHRMLVAE
jgi:hypothetical protein